MPYWQYTKKTGSATVTMSWTCNNGLHLILFLAILCPLIIGPNGFKFDCNNNLPMYGKVDQRLLRNFELFLPIKVSFHSNTLYGKRDWDFIRETILWKVRLYPWVYCTILYYTILYYTLCLYGWIWIHTRGIPVCSPRWLWFHHLLLWVHDAQSYQESQNLLRNSSPGRTPQYYSLWGKNYKLQIIITFTLYEYLYNHTNILL